VEEQQMWLDRLQTVGLGVSETETHATTGGREGLSNGDVAESPTSDPVQSPTTSEAINSIDNFWRRKWQHSMRKVLSLPDATQAKKRAQVIAKLVSSESRYVGDLMVLSDQYYQQVKLAITAGLIPLPSDLLDTIFLNWLGEGAEREMNDRIAGFCHENNIYYYTLCVQVQACRGVDSVFLLGT
jgi:hypothetical protein